MAAGAVVSGPAAILDVDGTLVDSNYQHAVAWYRAFRQHGHVLPLWRVHRHIGMGSDQLVASLCGEAVEEQQGDDIRAAEKALYFAMIEEVEPLDLVEAALERVGGGAAVMIGDSTWDCRAAKRAGVETLAVLTGGFSEEELLEAGASAVFHSIEDLRRRLSDTPLG